MFDRRLLKAAKSPRPSVKACPMQPFGKSLGLAVVCGVLFNAPKVRKGQPDKFRARGVYFDDIKASKEKIIFFLKNPLTKQAACDSIVALRNTRV